MPPLVSTARSMASFSTGGRSSPRSRSAGPVRMMRKISAPRSASGMSATPHTRGDRRLSAPSGVTTHSCRFEKPHPAQLGKLALVSVEHELAGIAESCLEDRALALAEHDRVCRLRARHARAGAIEIEEHAVQMQAVDQIEL